MAVCPKCGSERDPNTGYCKPCKKIYDQKRYTEKRDQIIERVKRAHDPKKKAEYDRKYRERNRLELKRSKSDYYKRPEVKEMIRSKLESSPTTRANNAISSGIRNSLYGKKAGRKWESLVGYTLQDLIDHLESHFVDGMTWEMYGKQSDGSYGWEIDHHTPKSWFDYDSYDDEDFKRCWALENLRPVWASDNRSKRNFYAGTPKRLYWNEADDAR